LKIRCVTYGKMLVLLLAALWCDVTYAQVAEDTLTTEITVGKDTVRIIEAKQKATVMTEPLDTSVMDSLLTKALKLQKKRNFVPDPIRAMWLGLVIPGAGQIYNRKLWKLPIVYGGFLGCTYALTWNNQMLKDYSQAYIDIMDDDPNTKSYEDMLPMGYDITGKESRFQEIFKNKKNHFRKYRDMSILAFIAVYAISVIDAYVDAELSTFDVNEDLSIRFEPAVINSTMPGWNKRERKSYGLSCNIYF